MVGRRGGRGRGAKTAGRPTSNPNQSDDPASENEDVEQAASPVQNNSNESSDKEVSDNEGSKGKASSKNSDSGEKDSEGEKSDKEENSDENEVEESILPDKPVISKPQIVTFECSMCFFTTDNDDNFMKHMEELHRRDLGYWCKSCGTAYESATQLIEHIREYCDKIKHFQHACGFPDCAFKTSEPANLIFHFRNEHKGKYLFPCGQCEQQFTILTSLVLHQQDKCTNKHMCSLLSSGSTAGPKGPSDADKKKDNNNPMDDRFRCALCTFETTQRNMFVEHHTDLHLRDLCCCKRCGKVVKNAENLVAHIAENNCTPNRYTHPCGTDNCEFTTHDPLAYRNHIRNGHPRTSLQKCDGCKKQFTIIPLLIMHIQDECNELNTEGREKAPSNGNNASDTINNAPKPSTAATPAATGRGSRGGAKKSDTPKRGGGPGSRSRSRGGSAAKPAARGVKRRAVREKTPGSSDESEVDDPIPPPAPTPSRSSGRTAAKRVSYASSSHSDEEY